jgi:hypothetical protein
MNAKLLAALFLVAAVSAAGPLDPAKNFLEGVFRGYTASELPDNSTCLNDQDQAELVALVQKVIDDVNSGKGDAIIYGDSLAVYNDILPFYEGCGLSTVVNDITSYASGTGWVGIVKHFIKHYKALSEGAVEIVADLQAGDTTTAGILVGTSLKILTDGKCMVIEKYLLNKY